MTLQIKHYWQTKKLGECFKLRSGDNITRKMMGEEGKYPVYGGNGIAGMYDKFNLSGSNIVIGRVGALCGNVRHIKEKIWLTDNAFKITDWKYDFDHAFLTYLLNFKNLRSYARQAAQPVISNSSLEDVLLQFPKSKEEQKHIVAILDKAFAAVAKTKENAEKNLQNARELFESYLQNVFANPGEDWEEKKLGEMCEIRPPKNEARTKLKETDLVSFVPMEDLGIHKKKFIPIKEKQLKEVEGNYTYFANEDVLLAKITPCFENGKLGIARNLKNGIGFGSSEYIVFRTNKDLAPEFLYYYLSRNEFRQEGAKRMMGAVGHKRVSKEFIENSVIPFPDISKQRHIITKLDVLSTEIKKLETIYRHKLSDLEELKKSVLRQAFNGEL
ncbi:MAG: restriction endonuclease subunit S [Elusimicrobiota bacterium]